MKRNCSELYLHFLLDLLSSFPERFMTQGRQSRVETSHLPPFQQLQHCLFSIAFFWEMFYLGRKRLAVSSWPKRKTFSLRQSKRRRIGIIFLMFRLCQNLIFWWERRWEERERGQGKASNLCQELTCMSIICSVFPLLLLFFLLSPHSLWQGLPSRAFCLSCS